MFLICTTKRHPYTGNLTRLGTINTHFYIREMMCTIGVVQQQWAARYNIQLLIELMPKGALFSFLSVAEAQQSPPSAAFQSMVTTVHQQLTPNVYTFIFDASTHEDEEDQNEAPNPEKKARKAKKEGKQIGLLVKAIEEWEFNLIKLTRSCKSLLSVGSNVASSVHSFLH